MFPFFYLLGIVFLIIPTVRLPILGLSPSDVFIFAAFGWLLLEAVLPRRERRAVIPIHALWIPAMLILVGGMIASLQAVSPPRSLWATVKVWFVVAPWVSMGIVMVRRGYLMHILYAFVLAASFSAAVAMLDQVTGWQIGPLISGIYVNYWTRSAGTFGHPSTLGYLMCVAVPMGFGLFMDAWQQKRRASMRITLGVANLLLIAALFNSGSVTAWVGTVVAFAALGAIWLVRAQVWMRWGAAMVGMSLVLLLGAIVLLDLVPENVQAVLDTNLGRAAVRTGPGRIELLEAAFVFIDQDPFIGSGMDQTGTGGAERGERETGAAIHNTIISGWLNGGLLTFVGMVLAYAIAVLTAFRGLNYGAGHRNWIVLTLSAATLAWIVFDQTQPQLSQRFTWMTVSLLFGLGFGIQWAPTKQVTSATGGQPTPSFQPFPANPGKAGARK